MFGVCITALFTRLTSTEQQTSFFGLGLVVGGCRLHLLKRAKPLHRTKTL
jgi:hypothetical protein